MTLSKPTLGLAVGGILGLLDGLSGFREPSLAPVMGSVNYFLVVEGARLRTRDRVRIATP
jgi:hypothetical protein